jgi:hypothetical protein
VVLVGQKKAVAIAVRNGSEQGRCASRPRAKPYPDRSEAIPFWVWPWLFAGGLLFFIVVEPEKLIILSSDRLRRSVTAAEAGA